MQKAHENGTPPMRPLFYDFPEDPNSWEEPVSFMFGDSLLISPITEYKKRSITVYLPSNEIWLDAWSGSEYSGSHSVEITAPLDVIPVFIRKGSKHEQSLKQIFDKRK